MPETQSHAELLSFEEEQVLARRIQNKTKGWKQARQRFREANLGLVVHIAQRFERFHLPLEDKIQEGNLGLMRAVDSFQPGMSRFSAFAGVIIERAILRACRENSTIRVPEHLHVQVRNGREAPSALQDFYPLFDEDISEEEEINEAEEARERVSAFRENIRDLLFVLTDREATIVSMRLGLDGKAPRNQREIGDLFGVTRAAIHFAEKQAIAKLEAAVSGERPEVQRAVDASHGSYIALFLMLEETGEFAS